MNSASAVRRRPSAVLPLAIGLLVLTTIALGSILLARAVPTGPASAPLDQVRAPTMPIADETTQPYPSLAPANVLTPSITGALPAVTVPADPAEVDPSRTTRPSQGVTTVAPEDGQPAVSPALKPGVRIGTVAPESGQPAATPAPNPGIRIGTIAPQDGANESPPPPGRD